MNATLRHVGIRVTNMVDSVNFYQRLGFKAFSCIGEKWGTNGEILCVKMNDRNGGVLELIDGPWGKFHIAFTVDEIPMNRFNTFSKGKHADDVDVIYITDPSGYEIELVKQAEEVNSVSNR